MRYLPKTFFRPDYDAFEPNQHTPAIQYSDEQGVVLTNFGIQFFIVRIGFLINLECCYRKGS